MNMENNTDSDAALFPHHLRKQLEARMEQLAREDICLAFSGGVDSSLLLKAAADAAAHTGSRVYAVTFDSRLHPSCDLEIARRVAGELGGIHEVITVDELEQEAIKNNPVNRCYLCKRHLFLKLTELAEARGIRHILDGTNEDDMHVYRPGIRALKELGILSPLAELHITKAQVKAMASEYGISVASRPSTPCMATRLPYGALLDYEVLERIGEGESYVRTIIPGNVRLRLHGDIVRLELDTEAFGVFMERREEIVSRLKEMGFVYITLDAEGFRSGSMDTGVNEGRMKD
ncbi:MULTISPECIES: ATP-dependent sacrificial sulfur transferase LarE [unclassified Clostridium]|uniref:ATP-dependent sacrificial sulfur transferase LarE n=1 Tax=unclassified Clostridium TaxID=2614128 RepID=UPI001106F2FA|nr:MULTISPECIES: ATP-dependent sacrificial sulfur transferase LarE [unclassified Clostridium]